MTDEDGHRLEAADQFGFVQAEDDGPYTCTEAQLIAFAKGCERKGRAEAIQLLEQTTRGLAVLRILRERNATADAELVPILAAEEERSMLAAGAVMTTSNLSDLVLPVVITEPASNNDFWCIVALDYDKDDAWILDKSADARDCDLLDGSSGDDNGLIDEWIKSAVPGLYKLYLRPWSHQDYQGEWDTGVDVSIVEMLVAFPEREPREPCEYCGTGKHTGLPGNACENCMNTGFKYPTAEDLS